MRSGYCEIGHPVEVSISKVRSCYGETGYLVGVSISEVRFCYCVACLHGFVLVLLFLHGIM